MCHVLNPSQQIDARIHSKYIFKHICRSVVNYDFSCENFLHLPLSHSPLPPSSSSLSPSSSHSSDSLTLDLFGAAFFSTMHSVHCKFLDKLLYAWSMIQCVRHSQMRQFFFSHFYYYCCEYRLIFMISSNASCV